nr:MAG TPA: hypothetical protein [Caudoviricetes sp.]
MSVGLFPLLGRVHVVDANVLQSFKVENHEAKDFKTKVLNVGKFDYIDFSHGADLTEGAISEAIRLITYNIYKQVEKELFDLAKAVTGEYVQGANDIMFVKDNDFVQLSIPVFETDHFDVEDTFDKIVINPDTAILIGSLVPEFVITKQANTNKVRVYGTLTVEGGFFGTGVVKKIGG